MSTNESLKEIMAGRNLKRTEVAALTCSSISAVDNWLRPTDSAAYREMPTAKFELLKMKLGQKQP